jgi:hypothetical protein
MARQHPCKCLPEEEGQTARKLKRINLQIYPQLDERILMQIKIKILTNKSEFESKLT